MQLVFDASAARGAFGVSILQDTSANEPEVGGVAVVASFPGDGCAPAERPVAPDQTPPGFTQSPRALYEGMRSRWEATPIPAEWENGTETSVRLDGSDISHACQFSSIAFVHASQRVISADGNVAFERPIIIDYRAGTDNVFLLEPDLAIPVADFERMTGSAGWTLLTPNMLASVLGPIVELC